MPKAISFVARLSGTGKTTLVEAIIKILSERGYRVGAIKHDAHDFEIDKPGKDSYRFTAAGAATMILASKEKTAVVQQNLEPPALEVLLEQYCSGVDLVVVEGFKDSSLPKIEVHRHVHCPPQTLASEGKHRNIIAIVSDAPCATELPMLDLNDPQQVVDFILKYLSLPQPL